MLSTGTSALLTILKEAGMDNQNTDTDQLLKTKEAAGEKETIKIEAGVGQQQLIKRAKSRIMTTTMFGRPLTTTIMDG